MSRVGPLDQRTRRSRCAACTKRHMKCQGGIPCAYCNRTQQICVPPVVKKVTGAVFINSGTRLATKGPASVSPVSPGIPQSNLEDQSSELIRHFFSVFLHANNFANGTDLDLEALDPPFQASPSLYKAVVAIAILDASRNPSRIQALPKVSALEAYRTSLVALQVDLVRNNLLENDACLWSTFFLGIFELMIDSSGDGWVKHILYGTSRLLQHRGPSRHVSGSGRSFFLTVRIFEICRALIFSDSTFLSQQKWMELMEMVWSEELSKEWHPKETLFDLMISCASLNNRARLFIQQDLSTLQQCSNSLLSTFSNEGLNIQKALCQWQLQVQEWTAANFASNSSGTGETDTQTTIATIFHHATLIFLSGIFDYHHHWDHVSAPKLQPLEIQQHVAAILNMSEAALKNTNLAGILFLYPLRVAGARARTAQQRARILAMFQVISTRSFVVANAFKQDLIMLWNRRDAS